MTDAATGRLHAFLDRIDLDSPTPLIARIPLDFQGHGVTFDPRRPHEAVVLEKRGPGGCRVDLVANRMGSRLVPLAGHRFGGHAAWSADGQALFVLETEVQSGQGVISVRDRGSLLPLGRISTGGHAPHDCRLAPGGRALVVANGGGPVGSVRRACVAVIDLGTGALLQRHELDDPGRNAGHLAVGEGGGLAVVSAPREGLPEHTAPGGVALGAIGAGLACMTAPPEVARGLVGEALSVAIHPASRTVAATHPHADLLSLWTLDGGFRATLAIPQPRGVTVADGGEHFVVSCGADGRLLAIDPRSLRVQALDEAPRGFFGGAHLYAWPGPARR